jgi:feruloyl esterase
MGNNTGATGAQDNALLRGFAVVTTDAGHLGANPLFGLDPLARIDHAYNAYDVTTRTAKALINARYGRQPDRSYFIGCSGGGNQGLTLAQRFPQHFDGVIATAPAMSVAKGASISVAWMTQPTPSRPSATRRTAWPTGWCRSRRPAASTPRCCSAPAPRPPPA